ncbi:MAG: glycosyltransferase family 39 protein [Chloroflexi bacterium]|nr:glycosyltransferase family 39 protein [Chloroflexota bacterium]
MNMDQIRRHLPAIGLILVVAIGTRLAWTLAVHPNPLDGRFDDTAWYRSAAHYFANGDGYVNPFTGTPTAAWPPGYPVVLGSVFSWFGEGNAQVYGLNIVLAAATVLVAYELGLALFERRTAFVGALALALWPGQVYFSSLTLSEPLFTLFFVTGLLLMVLAAHAGPARRGPLMLALGVVTGAAVLTRGQAALLLPLAVLALLLAGQRWRASMGWVMLAAFAAAVVIAPWVVRNQRQLGSPVIVATNFGPNMWIGNHDGASGRMQIAQPEPPQPVRGSRTQPEFEVAADRLALREALSYMVSHPLRELRLSVTKVRAMYESDATGLDWNSGYRQGTYRSAGTEEFLRRLANGFWFAALALAGVGLVASRERLGSLVGLLPLTLLLWTATHLLFFGDSRFHYPVVFAIALLGARGLLVLVEAVRRPSRAFEERYAAA